MKRHNNLYSKIIKLENIELAHRRARKGKSHYKEVKMVDREPSKHFKKIRNMLRKQTFRNSNYKVFITNDSGKERTIYKLPYFPDRIVHQWPDSKRFEGGYMKRSRYNFRKSSNLA